jgi:transcriptional regulator with XRE-family HTH domain
MSKAISFGNHLNRWRERAGLSQRELAKILGVQASYLSYIEQNKRKPSLPLLLRAASTIGIDAREAFLLVHPECESFVGSSRKTVREDAWTRFSNDRRVLLCWQVTRSEMLFLKRLNTLGIVKDPRSFLLVLNSVRQALQKSEGEVCLPHFS